MPHASITAIFFWALILFAGYCGFTAYRYKASNRREQSEKRVLWFLCLFLGVLAVPIMMMTTFAPNTLEHVYMIGNVAIVNDPSMPTPEDYDARFTNQYTSVSALLASPHAATGQYAAILLTANIKPFDANTAQQFDISPCTKGLETPKGRLWNTFFAPLASYRYHKQTEAIGQQQGELFVSECQQVFLDYATTSPNLSASAFEALLREQLGDRWYFDTDPSKPLLTPKTNNWQQ